MFRLKGDMDFLQMIRIVAHILFDLRYHKTYASMVIYHFWWFVLPTFLFQFFFLQERGQVFSWLDHLSETNELIRPAKELKRCLLEMLLHSCMSEIRDAGMYKP